MKKNVIVFFLVLMFHQPHLAKANILPLQSENPIANFVLNEDDTTRYTHHYLYEQAYQTIEDMLVGRRAISLKDAEFAIENAFLEGHCNQQAYNYTIAPNQWESFEQQLQKVNSFHLKLNRR